MPRCLNCAEIVSRADSLCASCERQGALPTSPPAESAPGSGETSSAGDCPGVQSTPPAAAEGWSKRYIVAAVAGAAGAAALTFALLGMRGPGGESSPPVDEASVAGLVRTPGRSAPASAPKWTRANSARWVSNHPRSIAFELPAENTATAWLTRVRPILVVRCLANTTEAFVFTQVPAVIEPQDDRRTVHVSFDDEAAVTERWAGSADHDALFAPDAVTFARRLARARTMRFVFTPHNGPTANIEFQVDGFAEHVGSVARLCRWK